MSGSTWPPDVTPAGLPAGLLPSGDEIPAAVLVAIFTGEGEEAGLVLTRRRGDLRRHAGEISFPGGRRDADDGDLAETALREAEEEIGLPREAVSLIGTLPSVPTFATNYVIHPFVGTIPAGITWKASPGEVDEVLELSIADVSAGKRRTQMERRGFSFETDAYVVGEHLIWGATARIIELLLERLRSNGEGGIELIGGGEVCGRPDSGGATAPSTGDSPG